METNNHIVIVEPPNIQILHVGTEELQLTATYGSKVVIEPPIEQVVHVDSENIKVVAVDDANKIKISPGGITNLTDLFDTPQNYIGSAGKALAVKSDESGIEFVETNTSVQLNAMDEAIVYAIIFGS